MSKEKSREGYNLEERLKEPQFEIWNESSYILLSLIVLGRDGMGIDLGYDVTGLQEPPTKYERILARKLLEKALKEVQEYPAPYIKNIVRRVLDWSSTNSPTTFATDMEIALLLTKI